MNNTRTQLDLIYQVTDSFFGLFRAQQRLDIAMGARDQQKESTTLAKRPCATSHTPRATDPCAVTVLRNVKPAMA